MLRLRKYAIGQAAFDESKVRRDDDGRFASKGGGTPPSFRQRQLVERSPGRLFEEKWGRRGGAFQAAQGTPPGRGHNARSSWEKLGNKNPKLPESYTGSTERELPVDGYLRHGMSWQWPKDMPRKDHDAIRSALVSQIIEVKQPTLDRATEKGLIPEGTNRRLLNRAYNLASMRALHEYGVGAFDYAMTDELKQEMLPLVPAMRYFQRRIANTMRSDVRTKGLWQPYKAEFGVPYADNRLDRRAGKQNQLRLKWVKSQGAHTEFIKATMPGELMKGGAHPGVETSLEIADGIIRASMPKRPRRGPPPGAAPPQVLAVLPTMRRVVREGAQRGIVAGQAPGRMRHKTSERVIRDPNRPLHHVLG